jgi:hypothetical protein
MKSYEKIFSFLERQKQENLRLDEAEGKLDRERSGFDKPGLRSQLYQNTIDWVKMESRDPESGMHREFSKLAEPDVLTEDTLTTAIATFTTSLMPAIRQVEFFTGSITILVLLAVALLLAIDLIRLEITLTLPAQNRVQFERLTLG